MQLGDVMTDTEISNYITMMKNMFGDGTTLAAADCTIDRLQYSRRMPLVLFSILIYRHPSACSQPAMYFRLYVEH